MSLVHVATGLLNFAPRVRVQGPVLEAWTSPVHRALTLSLRTKHLHIDRSTKRLSFLRRSAWFVDNLTTRRFDEIDHVKYRFAALPTALGWSLDGYGRTDQVERFSVELVMKNGDELHLFDFIGEGSVGTGWMGVLMGGDDLVDWAGRQESESLAFVELLSTYLEVPLGPRLPSVGGFLHHCTSCQRSRPPREKKCLYCGGQVIPSAPKG